MHTTDTVAQSKRPASLVDWSMSSQWVDVDFAAYLLGVDTSLINELVSLAGVEAVERDGEMLIERDSLREFWDLYHETLGSNDRLPDNP